MPKAKSALIPPFPITADDPLADAHAAVSAWVEEAVGSLPRNGYFMGDVALSALPSGQKLLERKPETATRAVVAAVAQIQYWDQQIAEKRAECNRTYNGVTSDSPSDWVLPSARKRHALAAVNTLMRRSLPFQLSDLLALVRLCNSSENPNEHNGPVKATARAFERVAEGSLIEANLFEEMRSLAAKLRNHCDQKYHRLSTRLEQLCRASKAESVVETAPVVSVQPAPRPSPVGTPHVLVALKRWYGIPVDPAELASPTTPVGFDDFPVAVDSPLRPEHEWLGELLGTTPTDATLERKLLEKDPATLGRVILAAAERQFNTLITPDSDVFDPFRPESWGLAVIFASRVLKTRFQLDRAGLFDLNLFLVAQHPVSDLDRSLGWEKLSDELTASAAASPPTEGERYVLALLRAAQVDRPLLGADAPETRWLLPFIGDGLEFFLMPGEVWSDAANIDLSRLDDLQKLAWTALLKHAQTLNGPRPSAKWLMDGRKLVSAVGDQGEPVQQALLRWFPLVAKGPTTDHLPLGPGHQKTFGHHLTTNDNPSLRGLLWLATTLPRPDELARTIANVATWAYKKLPGIGPRALKVGNTAVAALAELKSTAGVGQLAVLKGRVKFGSAQIEIEKAFARSAEALSLPRDQIEELSIPSYGLEDVGRRVETFGDYRAELVVNGTDARLRWFDPKGKTLKSVPTKVKAEHKGELKELQQAFKDIEEILPAQRNRLDGMFLLQKSWPIADWIDRYDNHPLVGTLARRLIWRVDGVSALFVDGKPTDIEGHPITPHPSTQITTWHPVGCSVAEVTAWRDRLESLGVTQPFKQAHREVYLLTDAERNTRTYSNRFAAHILRQHQFNALCAARGWRNKLRLMVAAGDPAATRVLPLWDLRAEFWVDGIGDDYKTDTNESGVYLRLTTDQVRFYRTAAATNSIQAGTGRYEMAAAGPGVGDINEPLPLDQIPPLVLSEILRDVDLFVGVASVGNDPTWQDGGPEGRYRTYWQSYSFGELSGTATTRKEVLERLIPRLKIADRCSLVDRFLVVRGQKRTYKIHFSSGNILMEPNDQYLCIVPDARSRTGQDDLFLPFEGDNMLSIILSKAILLADDSKIKDPFINSQINHH